MINSSNGISFDFGTLESQTPEEIAERYEKQDEIVKDQWLDKNLSVEIDKENVDIYNQATAGFKPDEPYYLEFESTELSEQQNAELEEIVQKMANLIRRNSTEFPDTPSKGIDVYVK